VTRLTDHQIVVTFNVWSDFKVYVVFTKDLAASRIKRYETAGVAADSSTAALFTKGAGGYGHLFFKPDACAEIIAHECCHAVWYLFEWAGVAKWDNETLAYHIGHLVGRVSEFQAEVLKNGSAKRKSKRSRTR
jgi:hypothetical protein